MKKQCEVFEEIFDSSERVLQANQLYEIAEAHLRCELNDLDKFEFSEMKNLNKVVRDLNAKPRHRENQPNCAIMYRNSKRCHCANGQGGAT